MKTPLPPSAPVECASCFTVCRLNMDRELQPAGTRPRFNGSLHCLRHIWTTEGLAGMQRGLSFAMVLVTLPLPNETALYSCCSCNPKPAAEAAGSITVSAQCDSSRSASVQAARPPAALPRPAAIEAASKRPGCASEALASESLGIPRNPSESPRNPSQVREASKNSFRIGLYDPLLQLMHADRSASAPWSVRLAAGLLSGAIAALVCNPLDLLKVASHRPSVPALRDCPTARLPHGRGTGAAWVRRRRDCTASCRLYVAVPSS